MGGGAGIGVVEPPDPRNRPGQLDDAAIVDFVEHGRTADLSGRVFTVRAWVYCLHPPIDYIGAGVVELKFGPGASAGKDPGLCAARLERQWTPLSSNGLPRCSTTCTLRPCRSNGGLRARRPRRPCGR